MKAKITSFYKPKGYAPQDSVAYMMKRIIAQLTQHMDKQLEATELTNAQWIPLLKIHLGTATTVAELAKDHQIDVGAMTRLLDRLEKKELCTRTRSEQDRRVVNLSLTDKGREVALSLAPLVCQVQNASLAGFSEVEWLQLRGFLGRILDNVSQPLATEEKI